MLVRNSSSLRPSQTGLITSCFYSSVTRNHKSKGCIDGSRHAKQLRILPMSSTMGGSSKDKNNLCPRPTTKIISILCFYFLLTVSLYQKQRRPSLSFLIRQVNTESSLAKTALLCFTCQLEPRRIVGDSESGSMIVMCLGIGKTLHRFVDLKLNCVI